MRFTSMIVLWRRSGINRALPQWMSEIWQMVSRPFASISCSGSFLVGSLSPLDISASPVELELGSEGSGIDLAQRPVPSPSWRQEVGLGAVEDDEGNGAGLDHVIPVERDIGEDRGRGLFRPGLVEEEVADAVV